MIPSPSRGLTLAQFSTPNTFAALHEAIHNYEDHRSRIGPIFTRTVRRYTPIMSAVDSNSKLAKSVGIDADWAILSLSLAPADSSGIEVCPMRSQACTEGCLGHNAGHGCMGIGAANNRHALTPVRIARIKRTQELFGSNFGARNQQAALAAIDYEIGKFTVWCAKKNLKPAVRLNAFSDITWEAIWPELFVRHAGVQFYDYTKIPVRLSWVKKPVNYHLTLSRSENNAGAVDNAISAGHNVAVVFGVKDPQLLPKTWHGVTVIDGTAHDKRFLDPKGVIVGLSWKGPAGKAAYFDSLDVAISRGFAVSLTSSTL